MSLASEGARCSLFGSCGGCTHQNLEYEDQVHLKFQNLVHLLKELPCRVEPVVPCVDPWRYRNKMEFVFGANDSSQLILGLRRRGSFLDVLDIEDCWIHSEAGNRVRRLTRDFFRQRDYLPYHPRSHKGLLRFLIVRQSYTQNKLMVNLVVADRKGLFESDVRAWIHHLTNAVPELASIYLSEQSEWGDTAFSNQLELLWGEPCLYEYLSKGSSDPLCFKISPLAFFQTNSLQAQLLYQTVIHVADLQGDEVVLDLHCGTGTIGQLLAGNARHVYGIEVVPAAIADAQRNAKGNAIYNTTYIVDKAETWLKWNGDEVGANLWILDPPRSGLHPKILNKRIGELTDKPDKIVYVSCNPQHLPTDLSKLLPWYRIDRIVPVDMFPHTPHLEVVVSLQRQTN